MLRGYFNIMFLLIYLSPGFALGGELSSLQAKIRTAGDDMLETLEVSYVYGGAKVGDTKTCDQCNSCLEDRRPAPKQRFLECPTCGSCSLDCSHFTQMVFTKAGLAFPYITTGQMLDLAPDALAKKYHLRQVGTTVGHIIPGDMLVYRGHVVIVEAVHDRDSADIIHATGGKDIKEPGQGIQRERFVRMSSFRGELQKVIRHARLDSLFVTESDPNKGSARGVNAPFKLRPVEKKLVE